MLRGNFVLAIPLGEYPVYTAESYDMLYVRHEINCQASTPDEGPPPGESL
jgi:hypothetical protein